MVVGLSVHGFLAHIGLMGWAWVLEYRPDLDKVVDSYCGPSAMRWPEPTCQSDLMNPAWQDAMHPWHCVVVPLVQGEERCDGATYPGWASAGVTRLRARVPLSPTFSPLLIASCGRHRR